MLILPKAISTRKVPGDDLRADYLLADKFGQGRLGYKQLFLTGVNGIRTSYIPIDRIDRVYKRLGVTKGFFEGGVFGTLSYVVVQFDKGQEKAFRFKYEEDVDELLKAIKNRTNVPVGKK